MANTIEARIEAARAAIPSIPQVKQPEVHLDLSDFPKAEVPKVNVDIGGAVAKINGITETPEFKENLATISNAASAIADIVN